MTETKTGRRRVQDQSRCQIRHFPGIPPASCSQPAKINVDGLFLCEKHALEVKLEGQISCWDEMLFHIDLWSREASRQDRVQIVELLDAERTKVTSAIEWAHEDLDLARSETSSRKMLPGSRGI